MASFEFLKVIKIKIRKQQLVYFFKEKKFSSFNFSTKNITFNYY